MRDKKEQKKLQKEFADHGGLYLLESGLASAYDDEYLRTKKGRSLCGRLENRIEKGDLSDLVAVFTDENREKPFSQADFDSLMNAFTLSLLRYVAKTKKQDEREKRFYATIKALGETTKIDQKKLYEELSVLHRALMRLNPHQYKSLDDASRGAVREEVIRYAKKKRLCETEAAKHYTKNPPKPNVPLRRRIALSCFFTVSALLCVPVFYLCGILAGILLTLPMLAFAQALTQSILVRIFPPIPVYSLRPCAIPENAKTLVVITALLSGTPADKELFTKLRKYYLRNSSKNVLFGILADLPESRHANDVKDESILDGAKEMLYELQNECGDHFALFVRRRTRSSTEGNFMGWERKRGALLELCRAARGKSHTFTYLSTTESALSHYRYVITLDADTELSMGMVNELVYTMLHPENKPIIEGGIVVSGYGILQPRMVPSLLSAGKSMFSVLQAGSGGKDSYAFAAGDFDQSTFGKSGFCGKGIFDVDAFLQTLDGAYPDERILSHDLLESTRLRCGALTGKSFIDAIPSNAISYYKRQHRWMRGDLQSLPFSLWHHKNKAGKRVKNPIDLSCRLMLWRNLLFLLQPIFSFFAIVAALFLPSAMAVPTLLFATLHLIFPMVKSIVFTARTAHRRFYSSVLQGLWHSVFNAFYNLMALCEVALLHLDALLRSVLRMSITHKHLLQWVTADHVERGGKNSLAAYVTGMWKSIAAGIFILFLAPSGLFILYGILTVSFPFLSFLICRPLKDKAPLSPACKMQLRRYAADAFGYYERFVTESDHYLPPDNHQFSPVAVTAHRTSPTNIAMYLLSLLAGADFELITPAQLYERLKQTLDTVDSLVKYKGHLYNWYSTETLEVLGMPYISTVDSGNLITSLVALRQGIMEYALGEQRLSTLLPLIDKLIDECDFTFLYNKSRKLFYIGYDPVANTPCENCYDLYMSESRTTSYYAVAKGIVEKEHWSALSRPLVKSDGHMGMASWSGTAFEYFMPALLLPTYRNSLCYECLGYALFEQAHDDSHGLWGRSESGYYAFDNDMNYQYKAFGAHTLALDPDTLKNDVLAPYASFLMLPMSHTMPLANLNKMKNEGFYGPYGFYEAIDYTPSRVGKGHGVVRSYMAHHVGMTILACANAVKDDIFVKRFMRQKEMDAADELLQERIPVNAPIKRRVHKRASPPALHKRVLMPEDFAKHPISGLPLAAGLMGEGISLLASSAGDAVLMAKSTALTYPLFDEYTPLRGLGLLVRTDKGILDAMDASGGKFGRFSDALVYAGKQDGVHFHTAFTVSGESPLLSLQLTLEGQFKEAEPILRSEVILARTEDWLGHPNYTGLFVQSRHLPEDNALLFKRRPKKDGEKPLFFLLTMEGGGFDFITRRDTALPTMYDKQDLYRLFEKTFDNKDGGCIMPYLALRRKSQCPTGKYTAEFIFGAGENADELLKSLRALRREKAASVGQLMAESYTHRMKNRLRAAGYDGTLVRYEQFILSSILYNTRRSPDKTVSTSPDLFWRHGVSTDLPMVSLVLPAGKLPDNVARILSAILRTQKYLSLGNFHFDILLFYHEKEQYACPARHALTSLITETVGEEVISRKGGAHLITDTQAQNAAEFLSPVFLNLNENTVFEKAFATHFSSFTRPTLPPALRRPIRMANKCKDPILSLSVGSFTKEGYRVEKTRCRLPQSMIYCSHQFGTLLTHNSLGVTYFRNASEFSLTRRHPDPLLDLDGEKLFLTLDNTTFDLCACSHTVDFTMSHARYEGDADTLHYTVLAGCDPKFPVKLVLLTLENQGKQALTPKIEYCVRPTLGKSRCIRTIKEKDTLLFRSLDRLDTKEEFGMYVLGKNLPTRIAPGERAVCHFLLGVINYQNDRSFYAAVEHFATAQSVENAFWQYGEHYRKLLSRWKIASSCTALDLMFNEYVPYQTLTSRIFARTGFYQSGGAFGFRDQLQDCVNMLPIAPDLTARQILRCATRQYAEGDVQHWWHDGTDGPAGMRTRCSDDLLWLPYATAEYVAHTGGKEILRCKLPYLRSNALSPTEDERYEKPAKTAHRESLAMHCMRAMDLVISRMGEHGLPLVGNGDWNDGMNRVGKNGKGESVWLGMFLVFVLERFCNVCLDEGEDKERYLSVSQKMRKTLLLQFEKDRFLRGYFHNGQPLGSQSNAECQIDVLPQAFAAFLFRDDPRARTAMQSVRRELFDRDAKILRLFAPAFDRSEPSPGYIRGYLPGVRENGGQYTHGAMWGAMAFFALGMPNEGYEVLSAANPASRCLIPSLCARYRLEPYALAGDIYAGEHAGRGGWSHYTGSAGWFYTAVLHSMLGYRCDRGKITLCPNLPDALPEITVKFQENTVTQSKTLQKKTQQGKTVPIN